MHLERKGPALKITLSTAETDDLKRDGSVTDFVDPSIAGIGFVEIDRVSRHIPVSAGITNHELFIMLRRPPAHNLGIFIPGEDIHQEDSGASFEKVGAILIKSAQEADKPQIASINRRKREWKNR